MKTRSTFHATDFAQRLQIVQNKYSIGLKMLNQHFQLRATNNTTMIRPRIQFRNWRNGKSDQQQRQMFHFLVLL
ncbi:Mediator of RNA polymerase II transcription subunit [Trichinella pseudospiralis]